MAHLTPRTIALVEPVVGVDVGAGAEIYAISRRNAGAAVLVLSLDLEGVLTVVALACLTCCLGPFCLQFRSLDRLANADFERPRSLSKNGPRNRLAALQTAQYMQLIYQR